MKTQCQLWSVHHFPCAPYSLEEQTDSQLRVFVGDTQEGHLCGSGSCHGVELRGILKMMVCSGKENTLTGVSCQEINPLIGHQL